MQDNKKGFQTYRGQEGGFTKGKPWLANMIAIWKEIIGLVKIGKSRGCQNINNLRTAFDTVSHEVLPDKLMKYRLDK